MVLAMSSVAKVMEKVKSGTTLEVKVRANQARRALAAEPRTGCLRPTHPMAAKSVLLTTIRTKAVMVLVAESTSVGFAAATTPPGGIGIRSIPPKWLSECISQAKGHSILGKRC